MLEGEMPCEIHSDYVVRNHDSVNHGFLPTCFSNEPLGSENTHIFSDWDAPEVYDATTRPYSIIAAPEGTLCKGKFSVFKFSIRNLDFRVPMREDKMYPTETAVNLQNVGRVHVCDSQFALSQSVGDTILRKELQPNPCHTAGLILSGDQNDNNVIRNITVQGYRYGVVSGENLVADYLQIVNCEEGITFHDCSHLSVINHIVVHHNAVILSTTDTELFGMPKGPCFVKIGTVDFESGAGMSPAVSALKYGVRDTDGRLHGYLTWHKPWGGEKNFRLFVPRILRSIDSDTLRRMTWNVHGVSFSITQ